MATIGQYRLIREIGVGGFARTYEAEHVLLGTKACLKQNLRVTPEDTELFKREAALLWNLNHHSLPSVKDFIPVKDGSYVLVMNYIEGRNLEEIVMDGRAIHPEEVSWIGQRLFQALHYLHSNGIVHADVKPQNVIVQPGTHNAVLVDYGLSAFRPKGDTKPLGTTPAYAAPEISQGRPPIPETDFYGAGITMIYALGGDVDAKRCPEKTPKALAGFIDELLQYDPLRRPNWERVDLVARLSDVRQEAFGRRHSV